MEPTHELTFAQQCAIASDCTVLFHGCKMTMGVQSAREIHYSPFCWPPPAAFPAAFVVAARSFGVAAPAFYCLGESSSFFSLSTAISFNHVDLLFRLIKFAHSAAKQRARS